MCGTIEKAHCECALPITFGEYILMNNYIRFERATVDFGSGIIKRNSHYLEGRK